MTGKRNIEFYDWIYMRENKMVEAKSGFSNRFFNYLIDKLPDNKENDELMEMMEWYEIDFDQQNDPKTYYYEIDELKEEIPYFEESGCEIMDFYAATIYAIQKIKWEYEDWQNA